jgi:hypothetical protein
VKSEQSACSLKLFSYFYAWKHSDVTIAFKCKNTISKLNKPSKETLTQNHYEGMRGIYSLKCNPCKHFKFVKPAGESYLATRNKHDTSKQQTANRILPANPSQIA